MLIKYSLLTDDFLITENFQLSLYHVWPVYLLEEKDERYCHWTTNVTRDMSQYTVQDGAPTVN